MLALHLDYSTAVLTTPRNANPTEYSLSSRCLTSLIVREPVFPSWHQPLNIGSFLSLFLPKHCHEWEKENRAGAIHQGEAEDKDKESGGVELTANVGSLLPEQGQQDGGECPDEQEHIDAENFGNAILERKNKNILSSEKNSCN